VNTSIHFFPRSVNYKKRGFGGTFPVVDEVGTIQTGIYANVSLIRFSSSPFRKIIVNFRIGRNDRTTREYVWVGELS